MNSIKPLRKKRKHQKRRRGGCLGNLFFLLIGLIAGGIGLYVYDHGADQALKDWKALFKEEEEPVAVNPSTGGKVVDAVKMDLRPLYLQDERWVEAIGKGEEGKALFELAVKDHYGDNGDPFLFRSRMSDASELMGEALESLRAMREQYKDKPNSVNEIDKMIRRYSGFLDEFGKGVR
ncbi:MAG: hypothetical protein QM477_04285 [Planctomycetota bacterium]